MAPLPQNFTARIFFDYITGNAATSKEHTVAWRYSTSVLPALDMQAAFLGFLTALAPSNLIAGWRVLRVRTQAAGALFSFPQTVSVALAAFVGTSNASYPQNREAEEWSWQGRSGSSGRRVDFSLYGLGATPPVNFRYPTGAPSPAWVLSTVNWLNAPLGPDRPVTIDFSTPVWYSYVNEQANSYWEEQIRRG